MENLQSHPEFIKLFKNIISPKSDFSLYEGGRFGGPENEYHIRIPLVIYFTEKQIADLKERFKKLDEACVDLTFEFTGVDDYDEEPGERYWDPRVYFTVGPRFIEGTDPAGGSGLYSHI